jgi:hypothetical protein
MAPRNALSLEHRLAPSRSIPLRPPSPGLSPLSEQARDYLRQAKADNARRPTAPTSLTPIAHTSSRLMTARTDRGGALARLELDQEHYLRRAPA